MMKKSVSSSNWGESYYNTYIKYYTVNPVTTSSIAKVLGFVTKFNSNVQISSTMAE